MANKTLWHGEARDLGQVEITIKSEAKKTKYPNKPDYVELVIDGKDRQYMTENPSCAEFFKGRVGQKIVVEFRDSKENASIHQMGPPAGQSQQRQPVQPASTRNPEQQRQERPADRQPDRQSERQPDRPADRQPETPAPAAPTPKTKDQIAAEHFESGRKAVVELMKAANRKINGLEVIMRAVDHLAKRRQETGKAMTPEHFQGTVTSIYISCERAGLIDSIPTGHLEKYLPEEKPKS